MTTKASPTVAPAQPGVAAPTKSAQPTDKILAPPPPPIPQRQQQNQNAASGSRPPLPSPAPVPTNPFSDESDSDSSVSSYSSDGDDGISEFKPTKVVTAVATNPPTSKQQLQSAPAAVVPISKNAEPAVAAQTTNAVRPTTGGKRMPLPPPVNPVTEEDDDEYDEDDDEYEACDRSNSVRRYEADLNLARDSKAPSQVSRKRPAKRIIADASDDDDRAATMPSVLDADVDGSSVYLEDKAKQLENEQTELSTDRKKNSKVKDDEADVDDDRGKPKKHAKSIKKEEDEGEDGATKKKKEKKNSKRATDEDDDQSQVKRKRARKPKDGDDDAKSGGRPKRKYVPKSERHLTWGPVINSVVLRPAIKDEKTGKIKKAVTSDERKWFRVSHFGGDSAHADYETYGEKGMFIVYDEAAALRANADSAASPSPAFDIGNSLFISEGTCLDGISKDTQTRLRQVVPTERVKGASDRMPPCEYLGKPTLMATQRAILLSEKSKYKHEYARTLEVAINMADEDSVGKSTYVFLSDHYAMVRCQWPEQPDDEKKADAVDEDDGAKNVDPAPILAFEYADPKALAPETNWIKWLADNHFTTPPPDAMFRHEKDPSEWDNKRQPSSSSGPDGATKKKKRHTKEHTEDDQIAAKPKKKRTKKDQTKSEVEVKNLVSEEKKASDDNDDGGDKKKQHHHHHKKEGDKQQHRHKDKSKSATKDEEEESKKEKRSKKEDDRRPKKRRQSGDSEPTSIGDDDDDKSTLAKVEVCEPKRKKAKKETDEDVAADTAIAKPAPSIAGSGKDSSTLYLQRDLTASMEAFSKLRSVVASVKSDMAPTMSDLAMITAYAWKAIGK